MICKSQFTFKTLGHVVVVVVVVVHIVACEHCRVRPLITAAVNRMVMACHVHSSNGHANSLVHKNTTLIFSMTQLLNYCCQSVTAAAAAFLSDFHWLVVCSRITYRLGLPHI